MEWIYFAGFRVIKRIFFIFCFLSLASGLLSQELICSIPREGGLDRQFFLHVQDDTILVVLYNNRLNEMTSLEMVSIRTKKTVRWTLPAGAHWIDIMEKEQQISLFYSFWNEELSMLVISEVRWADGSFSSPTEWVRYSCSSSEGSLSWGVRMQDDFIVFLSKRHSTKTNSLLAFQCRRIDRNWQLQETAVLQMDGYRREWEYQRWELDVKGNVWLIPGENRDYRLEENRQLPIKWEIYYYQFEARHLKEWDLMIGDKQIREAYWVKLSDQNLGLGILCSSHNQEDVMGWLQYVMDVQQGEVVKQFYQPFAYSVHSNKRWQGVALRQDSDGGFVLFGEHYFTNEIRTTDFQTGRTYSNWICHYGDIYFQKLKADLSLQDSLVIIHKNQEVADGEGCSFGYFKMMDNWFVEFNDIEDHDPWQSADRSWVGRKGVIQQVNVSDHPSKLRSHKVWAELPGKKGVWQPVGGGEGKFGIWWTINDILICRK